PVEVAERKRLVGRAPVHRYAVRFVAGHVAASVEDEDGRDGRVLLWEVIRAALHPDALLSKRLRCSHGLAWGLGGSRAALCAVASRKPEARHSNRPDAEQLQNASPRVLFHDSFLSIYR